MSRKIHDKLNMPEREGEIVLKLERIKYITQAITQIGDSFFKYGSICLVAFTIYLSISALAGKTTIANVGFKIFADMKIRDLILLFTSVGGVGYGIKERAKRIKQNNSSNKRIAELEKIIDRKRSSSHKVDFIDTIKENLS